MDIVKYIVEILLEKEQLVIPGLGRFIIEYKSTTIHPVDHTFSPPSKGIIFDEIATEDDTLARWISEKENISPTLADKEIKKFTDKIITDIQKKKVVVLEGLGTFSVNFKNIITFTASDINFSDDFFGLTEFQSPAIVRNEYKDMAEAKTAEELQRLTERKKRNRRYFTIGSFIVIFIAFLFVYFFTDIFNNIIHQNKTIIVSDIPKINTKSQPVAENHPQIIKDTSRTVQQQVKDTNKKQDVILNEKKTESVKVPAPKDNNSSEVKYYIIAGSFKIEGNANARAKVLQVKGYPNASVAKYSKNDFYVVYYDAFTNKDDAIKEQKKIISGGDKEAWIMKK